MRYPYILLNPEMSPHPIFTSLEGPPYILDLSDSGHLTSTGNLRDQKIFQKQLEKEMEGFSWGLSSYMENRKTLLSDCPQMMSEKRFFHLGLDIIVPLGTPLHAPLQGTVHTLGYEKGDGNYGGYILLEHSFENAEPFFSFYGHLDTGTLPKKGTTIGRGEVFAHIGDFESNGNWFYHTHLQVITQKGIEKGYIFKGYCSAEDLPEISILCPNPLMLFFV